MDAIAIAMLCLSFIAGIGVGIMFYMGLWWTVFIQFSSKHFGLWWWMSFIVRMAATAAIFYLIANEHLARYVLLLLGFLISRKIVIHIKTC